jgi:mRNA interferase RelE/StbE
MPKLLWGLALGHDAAAFLDDMRPGKIRAQIVKRYKKLQTEPFPHGYIKLSAPPGTESTYRIRQGDYRILYVVREQEVIILDIDNRKDVYR